MFSYIKLIYNIYNLYKNNNLFKDKEYRVRLKNNINDCGIFAIKTLQLLLPFLQITYDLDNSVIEIIKDEFFSFYDKCNTHDVSHTKKVYLDDFNEEIDSIYTIEEIIGSGSIAQVYKIRSKITNELYAMKVTHPVRSYEYHVIKFIFKIMDIFDLNFIRLDNKEFIKSMFNQFNLIKEVNNILEFKRLYESEIIRAPEIIRFSENIIIMEYIKKDESICEQLQLELHGIAFYIQFQNNWFHGDLHPGNIMFSNNCLYLIDFAGSYRLKSKNLNNEDIMSLSNINFNVDLKDYINILKLSDITDENIINKFSDGFKQLCETHKEDVEYNRHDKFTKYLIQFSKDNEIILNNMVVISMISGLYYQCFSRTGLYEIIIDCYNLCSKKNIYQDEFKSVEKFKKIVNTKLDKYSELKHLIKLD